MNNFSFDFFLKSVLQAYLNYPYLYLGGFHRPKGMYDFKDNSRLERLALLSIANCTLFIHAHDYITRNKSRISTPILATDITKLFDKNDHKLKAQGREGIILIAAKCAGMGITTDDDSVPNLIFPSHTEEMPSDSNGGIL